MNTEDLCTGCMYEKGTGSECPKCGWREGAQPESPLHLPPRTLLNNRYLIGRVLGHGGFGITYLARDTSLGNKFVAVKEYLPRDIATRMSNQPTVCTYSDELKTTLREGMEKFYEEANSLTQFDDHPGIVSVRDYFKENGTAYIVMPYLEGCTFKQYLLQKGGKISYEAALGIMLPVMDALREVHSVGILHRDISPDNIYITNSKQVKILDFGAARCAAGIHSKSLSVILKAGFAPEEQYRSKGNQGPWTDVYAVGATLYRSITGKELPESLDRIVEDNLEPPSKLGVDIAPHAERALLKALSVRAAGRFKTIKEFQDSLIGIKDIEAEEIIYCSYCGFKHTIPVNTPLERVKCSKCFMPLGQLVNNSYSQETIAVSSSAKEPKQNIVMILIAVFLVIGSAAAIYHSIGAKQEEEAAVGKTAVASETDSDSVSDQGQDLEPHLDSESDSDLDPPLDPGLDSGSDFETGPGIDGRWPITFQRRVTFEDLIGKTAPELDIMRNEIYARHGWVFLQPGLKSYFSEQHWYHPAPITVSRDNTNNQVVSQMSQLEKANALFILNYQKENNLQYYK